jgi:hypothetical protein
MLDSTPHTSLDAATEPGGIVSAFESARRHGKVSRSPRRLRLTAVKRAETLERRLHLVDHAVHALDQVMWQ